VSQPPGPNFTTGALLHGVQRSPRRRKGGEGDPEAERHRGEVAGKGGG